MSREEKLIDHRHRLREMLEKLYASYGGGELVDGARKSPRAPDEATASLGGLINRFVQGADRAHFDEYCLAVGRGERPFALSGKLEEFMKRPESASACRDAAKLQLAIDKLERGDGGK